MNKFYGVFLLMLCGFTVLGQEYKNGIGVQMGGFDFYGPQTGMYGLHSETHLVKKTDRRILQWDPAVQLSFWHAFNKKLDLKLSGAVGNIQYPLGDKDSVFIKAKQGLNYLKFATPFLAADAKINYSILPKEKFICSPYLCAGLSGTLRQKDFGLDLPLGLGLNIKIAKAFYINWESNYRMPLMSINQTNLSHMIGLVYWIKSQKPEKPKPLPVMETPKPAPVIVQDTDNDGIADANDKCPYHAGPKDKQGCPDKDNDGVYDFEDSCPAVAGLALYKGCPDTDGDGIVDSEDRCPNDAGIKENQGCPEIKQEVIEKVNIAAKGVNFESGKSVLQESSYKQLDIIVEALKSDPLLNADIEGHTDNKGKPEKNLILSQARADVCKDYLVQQGIDPIRITSVGYGDMKPIVDNNTEEGRAANRRTEFLLKR